MDYSQGQQQSLSSSVHVLITIVESSTIDDQQNNQLRMVQPRVGTVLYVDEVGFFSNYNKYYRRSRGSGDHAFWVKVY
jgi:hypothetical protein